MAASLTVFYNYTPNSTRGRYYMPRHAEVDFYEANTKMLGAFISEASQVSKLQSDTYRVYEEYIDLAQRADLTSMNITYIAIDNGKSILFYFVNSIKPMPQGYRCYISIDYWATYVSIANITKLHFTRSNLQLARDYENYYSTDEVINHDISHRAFYPLREKSGNILSVSRQDVWVVAAIKERSIETSNVSIEDVNLYAFNPQDIAVQNGRTSVTMEDIRQTIEEVFNIYEAKYRGEHTQHPIFPSLTNIDYPAEVTKVYLIPFAAPYAAQIESIYYKTFYITSEEKYIAGYQFRGGVKSFDYRIINNGYKHQYNPAVLNTHEENITSVVVPVMGVPLFFGTRYNNIKLPPFVLQYSVSVRYNFGKDEMTVTIVQGTEERDITSAFELTGSANTGTLTSQQRAAKWLSVAAQASSGVFQIAKGGAGIVSGGTAIASAIQQATTNTNGGTVIGTGDAYTTFQQVIETGSGSIICFTYPKYSALPVDPIERVITYGAYCDIQYFDPEANLLNIIDGLELLYLSEDNKTIYPAFACDATVDNIPADAAEYISNTLKEGVQIQFLS